MLTMSIGTFLLVVALGGILGWCGRVLREYYRGGC